jgi:hypothetical protein
VVEQNCYLRLGNEPGLQIRSTNFLNSALTPAKPPRKPCINFCIFKCRLGVPVEARFPLVASDIESSQRARGNKEKLANPAPLALRGSLAFPVVGSAPAEPD